MVINKYTRKILITPKYDHINVALKQGIRAKNIKDEKKQGWKNAFLWWEENEE